MSGDDTLARLAAVIDGRRGGDPDKSYVARLFSKGTDAILKKVGEEATEVVMAAKDGDRQRIVGEVADLWFHTLVALATSAWPGRGAGRTGAARRPVGAGGVCAAQGPAARRRRPLNRGRPSDESATP